MEVKFQTTKEDFNKFFRFYFFQRNLSTRLLLLLIISFWYGLSGNVNPISISTFTLQAYEAAIILYILFALVPYVIAKTKISREHREDFSATKTIATNDDGITITSERGNSFWKWELLNKVELTDEYLYISLFTKKMYVIPLKYFASKNEADNFFGIIKNGIKKVRGKSKSRSIRLLYRWGIVGIIPNFGVIIGIVLIIKGFQYSKAKLMLVGVADIIFTFVFWTYISPTWESKGFQDMSQSELNNLVKDIEFYKIQHGNYPDSLQQLLPGQNRVDIVDPIQIGHTKGDADLYNYKKLGAKYTLYSSGLDHIPNTKDDLFPNIPVDSGKIGLIKPQ